MMAAVLAPFATQGARAAFERVLREARWKGVDAFGLCSEIWNETHIAWLGAAERHGKLDYYTQRLINGDARQRRSTFAEIHAADFIERQVGLPVVHINADEARQDFDLGSPGGSIRCEVKAPGWDAELIDREDPASSEERRKGPKWPGYPDPFCPSTQRIIREVVHRARGKFPPGPPVLLVLVEDFRDCLIEDTASLHRALFEERPRNSHGVRQPLGYFLRRASSWCAGVAVLNAWCDGREVHYRFRVLPNPTSPQRQEIETAFAGWCAPWFPHDVRWGIGLRPDPPAPSASG